MGAHLGAMGMWGASAPKAENAATETVSPTAKRRVHFHGFPLDMGMKMEAPALRPD